MMFAGNALYHIKVRGGVGGYEIAKKGGKVLVVLLQHATTQRRPAG